MKKRHFLYGVVTLAVVGIFTCFIGYTTDILPKRAPKQPITVTVPSQPGQKKNCRCCAESIPDLVKTIRQNREEALAEKKRYEQAIALLKQYGPEEGFRRLKQSDPKVAAHIEGLIKKNPASSEKTAGLSP